LSAAWFSDAAPHELILRRALLALRARPALLAAFGRFLPSRTSQERWQTFVDRIAYWDEIRQRSTRDEWARLTRGVPVLLYHAFDEQRGLGRFVLPKRAFARQMLLLSLLRFRVIPYGDFAHALVEGTLPAPRTAVVTIDDGYADNLSVAGRVLARHGFPATVFLVSGRLGDVNNWSDAVPLRGRRLLSAEEASTLRKQGLEVGAHTRSHPSLPDLREQAIVDEVAGSRSDLERALGEPVRVFAYPYGVAGERAVECVRRAGFISACTTEPRLAQIADDPFLVPRIEIKGTDSLVRFLVKLCFGGR